MKTAALGIKCRHRARAVDANQPVALAAARRRVRERDHFSIRAQLRKTVANRRRRHGLQPQTLNRFVALRVLNNVTENQFPFAPGVARIDERSDILALDQLQHRLETRLALLNRQQIKVRRDHRQIRERPFAALHLELFGHANREQMADRRRDDVLVILEVVVMFFKLAERLADVAGDGRFFRDDESFSHVLRPSLSRAPPLAQLIFLGEQIISTTARPR